MTHTRPFNEIKLQWLALLTQDDALSSTAIVIAVYIITVHYNQGKGLAWPSFATIARATNKSVKTVQRAIQELDGTWFDIERGNGHGHSTTYAPSLSSIQDASARRHKHGNIVPLHPFEGGQKCSQRGTNLSPNGGQNCPPNTKTESRNEKIARLFVEFSSAQAHSWNAWLEGHDMKGMEDLFPPVLQHGCWGCYMPSRYPPTDTSEINIVLQHLRSVCTHVEPTSTFSHNI